MTQTHELMIPWDACDRDLAKQEAKYLKELRDERARIHAALLEQGYTVIDGVVTKIKKDGLNDD